MEQVQSWLLHAPVFLITGCNRNTSEDNEGRKEQFGL